MKAIVTGASSGIGYELVKALVRTDRITGVLAIARRKDHLQKLCAEVGRDNLKVLAADIRSLTIDQIKETGFLNGAEGLDLLVNNAGLLINKPFLEISADEIKESYDINVHAPVSMVRMLYPYLKQASVAHVVNIGSMGGFQGSAKFPGLSAYSSSKGALAFYSECMAEEFKEDGISVNCLALGAVQTEMLEKAFPGYQAPTSAKEMATFIAGFGLEGHKQFNGKVLPVSLSTP